MIFYEFKSWFFKLMTELKIHKKIILLKSICSLINICFLFDFQGSGGVQVIKVIHQQGGGGYGGGGHGGGGHGGYSSGGHGHGSGGSVKVIKVI